MKTIVRVASLVLAFGLLSACAQQQDAAAAPAACANGICPVSGEAVDASGPTSTVQGQTIGFCCEKCLAKFEAMDDGKKQAAVAAAKTK
jgi:YHS domain-containing protein